MHEERYSGGAQISTTLYYPAGGAMRVTGGSNPGLYFILSDHLGSTSAVTDIGGAEIGRTGYYPFGETRYSTGSLYTDKLYTGQQQVAGICLYNYKARFYDPGLGRFLSADTVTVGGPQGLNRYSYSNNNPIKYKDSTGHCPGPGGHDFPEGSPQCNSDQGKSSGIRPTKYSSEEEAILLKLISLNDSKSLIVVNYIRMNGVHIYADSKIKSGAEWGLDGNIYINTGIIDPNDPWTVTSALHEGLHLTQGKYVARSVFGEQEAWQLQYSAWQTLHGSAGPKGSSERELLSLPLDGKRSTLTKAENLMIKMSPGYPIKWYPLKPYPEFSIGMDIAIPLIHLYLGVNGYSYH